MVCATDNLLGKGMYTPAEAALYARIAPAKLRRWIFGTSSNRAAIIHEASSSAEKTVTFLDLIQSLAIRSIRASRKVSLDKIRQVIERAKEQFGIDYPFARRHMTYLFGDEIHLEIDNVGLVQMTGQNVRQLAMRRIVEVYLEDLSFDASTGLASQYSPMAAPEIKAKVVLDPRRRFGEPIVDTCGYTAQTLWESFQSEGGYDPAAKALGVTPEEIKLACRYWESLQIEQTV